MISNDDFFSGLLARVENPRLKLSLERVKAACDFLEELNVGITPTSVGRYCSERWGSPKPQSIRNANQTMLSYVRLRRSLQGGAKKTEQPCEGEILDVRIRSYVELLKVERDEAVRSKDQIIAGLRKVPGISIDKLIRSEFSSVGSALPEPQIDEQLVVACKKLIDPVLLEKVGLERYKGRVRSVTTNDVLLGKDDVSAIERLLGGGGVDGRSTLLGR